MTEPVIFSWIKIHKDCDALSERLKGQEFHGILSVTRGGLVPASQISRGLDIKRIETIGLSSYDDQAEKELEHIKKAHDIQNDGSGWLIIDDLCDSGKTFRTLRQLFPGAFYACLYVKPEGKDQTDIFIEERPQDQWIYFPWELRSGFDDTDYTPY